jgi:hypothetical protein
MLVVSSFATEAMEDANLCGGRDGSSVCGNRLLAATAHRQRKSAASAQAYSTATPGTAVEQARLTDRSAASRDGSDPLAQSGTIERDCSSRSAPDSEVALSDAWSEYQPNRALPDSVHVRRELFTVEALLLSAGMYENTPMDPQLAFNLHAGEFVRDLGAGKRAGLADAVARLAQVFEDTADERDSELGTNCGLVMLRNMFRSDPITMTTEFVFLAARGVAPQFEAGMKEQLRERARKCQSDPSLTGGGETTLGCTILSLSRCASLGRHSQRAAHKEGYGPLGRTARPRHNRSVGWARRSEASEGANPRAWQRSAEHDRLSRPRGRAAAPNRCRRTCSVPRRGRSSISSRLAPSWCR